MLEEVPPEYSFRLKNGDRLSSLRELAVALKTMDDSVFLHHVGDGHNDFAPWIATCIKDIILADRIRHVKDRGIFAREVKNRIFELVAEEALSDTASAPKKAPKQKDGLSAKLDRIIAGAGSTLLDLPKEFYRTEKPKKHEEHHIKKAEPKLKRPAAPEPLKKKTETKHQLKTDKTHHAGTAPAEEMPMPDLPSDDPSIMPDMPADVPAEVPMETDVPQEMQPEMPGEQAGEQTPDPDIESGIPPEDIPSELPAEDIGDAIQETLPDPAPEASEGSLATEEVSAEAPAQDNIEQQQEPLESGELPTELPTELPAELPSDLPEGQTQEMPTDMPSDTPEPMPEVMPAADASAVAESAPAPKEPQTKQEEVQPAPVQGNPSLAMDLTKSSPAYSGGSPLGPIPTGKTEQLQSQPMDANAIKKAETKVSATAKLAEPAKISEPSAPDAPDKTAEAAVASAAASTPANILVQAVPAGSALTKSDQVSAAGAFIDADARMQPGQSDTAQSEAKTYVDMTQKDAVVEIREITAEKIGVREIDSLFKAGIPKICNILFTGTMSTGKTQAALKMLLAVARKGDRAMFISLHETEEKIINILKAQDAKILDYINSGIIIIKKLDTFELARYCQVKQKAMDASGQAASFDDCSAPLRFIEDFNPRLVIVDSISALELSFFDQKMCYRHFMDVMFKYFERLGVLGIFVKELKDDKELNSEFYENILADIILHFHQKKNKTVIDVLKHYPVHLQKKGGFFSFLSKKK
jgi:KaiC/GvpD/RAD55 family RecA-like ATPase